MINIMTILIACGEVSDTKNTEDYSAYCNEDPNQFDRRGCRL